MPPTDRQWRLLGGGIGLLATVVLGITGGTIAQSATAGTDVHMGTKPTGELAVSPPTAFLEAFDLEPGHHVTGRLAVRNQTGVTLAVVAKTAAPAVLDILRVRVRAADKVVADGALSALVAGTDPWLLRSGQEAEVTFETWVEPSSTHYRGAIVDVDIRFEVRPEAL